MRLFVALDPPPEALAELEAAVAPLRTEWPELRWSGRDKWHVTLAFLGEVDEGKLDELAVRLARAAGRHPALELAIGDGGAFPSRKKARVFISHIEADQPALAALAASVAAGARRAGAPPPDEARKYHPHLTLARTRQPTDLTEPIAALTGFLGTRWLATEIHLIRSHGGPKTWYETLASWPLAG